MIWAYRILYIPFLIVMLPYFLKRMLKRGGYSKDFSHRFGLIPKIPRSNKKRIWIQAVSVGEINAINPLIDSLLSQNTEICLTTTTSTAYTLAQSLYADKITQIGIFPLDSFFSSSTAWNRINPDLAILMEGELWPEHIHQAHSRNIPIFLINARLSDKSFKRHKSLKFASLPFIKKITKILASNEPDRQRFIQLGYPETHIATTGNIKCDVLPPTLLSNSEKQHLIKELGFNPNIPTILGSSTWPGEEELLLKTHLSLLDQNFPTNLLIVPRHAERKSQLQAALPSSTHFRSDSLQAPPNTSIYVADTTGELSTLSQIASIAFIGKSIEPNNGGQTPIEPALLGLPIIYGPKMSNFKYICKSLEANNASIKCKDEAHVQSTIEQLIQSPSDLQSLSSNALAWAKSNQGASIFLAKIIFSSLK